MVHDKQNGGVLNMSLIQTKKKCYISTVSQNIHKLLRTKIEGFLSHAYINSTTIVKLTFYKFLVLISFLQTSYLFFSVYKLFQINKLNQTSPKLFE